MARELRKPNEMKKKQLSHEQISQRAYEIFVQRGCPEGRDLEHWLEAEAQLSGALQPQQMRSPSKSTKTSTRQAVGRAA
jgi:hypothetical protein